jgi:hypothetical protein
MSDAYDKIKDVVTTPILSWKNLLGLVFLVVMLCGVESLFGAKHKDSTVTAKNAICSVRSIDDDGLLHLACNAPGNAVIDDTQILAAYFKHPRPLVCKLYRRVSPDCAFVN